MHRIIIVEDNPGDVVLLRTALDESIADHQTTVIADGEEAITFISSFSPDDAERPCLFIVDLNLPRRDGLEVLRAIRMVPALRETAVAILTTSDSPIERREAQAIGVEAYLRKPLTFDAFMALGGVFAELCERRHR
jgi:CheY-like chemotaxis protein